MSSYSVLGKGLAAQALLCLPLANAFASVGTSAPPPISVVVSPPSASPPMTADEFAADIVSYLNAKYDEAAGLSEEHTSSLTNAIIFNTYPVKSEVIHMLSLTNGLEHWRSTVPPEDFNIEKMFSFDSDTAYDPAKIDKITEIYYEQESPEASMYLPRNDDMTLVREMITIPTDGNDAEDVQFELPQNVSYSGPSDLIYMGVMDMASLIQSRTVSCVDVITTFRDRLEEFAFLGYMITPLYESALQTAQEYDALLASARRDGDFNWACACNQHACLAAEDGTIVGPLMCIPYGMKDHHQIDTEPTSYGHILFYKQPQTIKSTVMLKLIEHGAIPLAKLSMGTLASGSVTGWGEVYSPYLNGNSGGSSCGSGSALAIGALPFVVSEETWGSIASPAANNLVSGHIPSYGGTSRAGCGLLASETDHIGFHARYLKDFGFIYNNMRTGEDPLDGDSVKVNFVNPKAVNLSDIKVLIVEGDAEWVYNEEQGEWDWSDDSVEQSYGRTAWKWPNRTALIKEALGAAGVPYETKTMAEMATAFQDYSLDPLFPDPDVPGGWLSILWQYGGGPAAFMQQGQIILENSLRKNRGCANCSYPKNIPMKSFRAVQYAMAHFGRLFLQDPFWDQYDVVIHSGSGNVPGYQAVAGNFEQWVRTSKTFVMDYMKEQPCMHTSGGTISGAYATLTALPFRDHINFAIGEVIQEYPPIKANIQLKPKEDIVKSVFANRTRCFAAFYEGFQPEACPPVNSPDGPQDPPGEQADMGSACEPGNGYQHVPTEFGMEPYVPPHRMLDPMPDRAIYKFDEYKDTDVCETFCKFVPTYCVHKGWDTQCAGRRKLESKSSDKVIKYDNKGKKINWNLYIDPNDPEARYKN